MPHLQEPCVFIQEMIAELLAEAHASGGSSQIYKQLAGLEQLYEKQCVQHISKPPAGARVTARTSNHSAFIHIVTQSGAALAVGAGSNGDPVMLVDGNGNVRTPTEDFIQEIDGVPLDVIIREALNEIAAYVANLSKTFGPGRTLNASGGSGN